MSNLKTKMLLGASVLASVAGLAGTASAATTQAYGGGSSLVAPYWRQAADCWGVPQTLVFKGTPPTTQTVTPFNYKGFNCATQHEVTNSAISYISTGSGTGVDGLFSHDPSWYGDIDPNTAGNQFYPSVQYGLSDNSLGATQVGIYNNGGAISANVTVVAPGQTPTGSQYANPSEKYGALIQFPISVDPVAITYQSVYRKTRLKDGSIKSYSFNVAHPRADGSGGLRLSAQTLCDIFNGKITNWNNSEITADNDGVSLKSPKDSAAFSVPLQIVGRFDSSGTTSIYTRHMAAACAATAGNQFADAASTLPASLQGAHYLKANPNDPPVAGETLGKFTLADGSDGVAKYVAFTAVPAAKKNSTIVQGRLAYIGPDYTLPAVNNTQTNTFGLASATLQNNSGDWVAPTGANALTAFGSLLPPQSTATGAYNPSGRGSRANPADWVEPASKTSVLADPVTSGAYPIVGTTNFLGYQCYANPNVAAELATYFTFYESNKIVSDPKKGLLSSAGLAPLPAAWEFAIRSSFVSGKDGLHLLFEHAGAAQCVGKVGG